MKAAFISVLLLASIALAAERTWSLAGGKTLRLDTSGDTKKLVDSSGATIAEFNAAEDVQGAVLSESRTCLLLLVDIERVSETKPGFRPYDYGYLLRVSSDSTGWHTTRLLDHPSPPMNELHRFISELGAVSDDGKIALLKFGAANRDQTPYTMDYAWQTWELDTPKLIGTGLKLANGKR